MKVYTLIRDFLGADEGMEEYYLEQIIPAKDQLDIEEILCILEEEHATRLQIEMLEEALGLSLS